MLNHALRVALDICLFDLHEAGRYVLGRGVWGLESHVIRYPILRHLGTSLGRTSTLNLLQGP